MNITFVHGRAQQGKDPVELQELWLNTLQEGLSKSSASLPNHVKSTFPFYGDRLDEMVASARTRGGERDVEYERFRGAFLKEILDAQGLDDPSEMDEAERGPLNWEWVHSILKYLDLNFTAVRDGTVNTFTRDVFLYLTRTEIRREIDGIVAAAIPHEPGVVVAHSLGTVVAFNVLRARLPESAVPLLVTLGCPLGVRGIQDKLGKPLDIPTCVSRWYNAYDTRDVVALYALDEQNFPTDPSIENQSDVRNDSKNRHSITGYLDDEKVASAILSGVKG